MIHAAIAALVECAVSRIIGKPQFVIKATLRDGQTGWAGEAGRAIALVSRENATIFRSRFTAALVVSKISGLPKQFAGARVEQIR